MATPYYTLITSLPRMPALFEAQRLPISPERLAKRLEMLDALEVALLDRILDLLLWDKQMPIRTDREMLAKADLLTLTSFPSIMAVVSWFTDVRTILTALRRRHRDPVPPAKGAVWSLGRWTEHLLRHWEQPEFGLERHLPWLSQMRVLWEAGESLAVERMLLDLKWKRLLEAAEQHSFDFEAVVYYVLRWHLLGRWLRYNGTAALARFDDLVDRAMSRVDISDRAMPRVDISDKAMPRVDISDKAMDRRKG